MSITVSCPACHVDVKVRDELCGRKVKCPKCREVISVSVAADNEPRESRQAVNRKRREDLDEEKRTRKVSRRSSGDEDDEAPEDEEDRPKALSHKAKVERLRKDMKRRGVAMGSAAPPLFRLLWAVGIPLPPPFFLGFLPNMLILGIPTGIAWGGLMWFVKWHEDRLPAGIAVAGTAAFGLLLGSSVAVYYQWKASSLKLSPWSTYPFGKYKRDPWWMVGPIFACLALVAIGVFFASEVQKLSHSMAGGPNNDDRSGLAAAGNARQNPVGGPAIQSPAPKSLEEEAPRSNDVTIALSNGRVTREQLFWPLRVDYRFDKGDSTKVSSLVLRIKPRKGPIVDIRVTSLFGMKAQGTIEGKLMVPMSPVPNAPPPDLGPFEAWLEMPRGPNDDRRVRVSDTVPLAY